MRQIRKPIFVNTPQGQRHHGDVIGDCFVRDIDWKKDRMRIFNALTIHPDALDEIKELGVKKLKYRLPDRIFTISLIRAQKDGFTKSFAGGITHYIPVQFWEVEMIKTDWECPRCKTHNYSFSKECSTCYLARPQEEVRSPETGKEEKPIIITGESGKDYKVSPTPNGWYSCTCEAFKYSGRKQTCKHIKAVVKRLQSEAEKEAAEKQSTLL